MEKYRAKIGIVGWKTGDNSFGATLPYLVHLAKFGDVEILTPTQGINVNLDLVVLPGGKDMPSFLYGQIPHFANSDSDQFKEWFIQTNLDQYIQAGVPIWGTCLGMQQLVVKYGGELCQDIPGSHGYSTESRSELVHDLIFTPKFKDLETALVAKRKVKTIKGNSLHHQGAYKDMIPDCFDIVCHTKDDIVEIIQHKELPIAAYQGHAEEDWNCVATNLIAKLLKRSPHYGTSQNTTNSSKLSD